MKKIGDSRFKHPLIQTKRFISPPLEGQFCPMIHCTAWLFCVSQSPQGHDNCHAFLQRVGQPTHTDTRSTLPLSVPFSTFPSSESNYPVDGDVIGYEKRRKMSE